MDAQTALTPRELGYRMPAEWEEHVATWLTWPRNDGVSYPGDFEKMSRWWAKMAEMLSPDEEVHINVFDEAHEAAVRGELEKAGLGDRVGRRIVLHRFPAYECWVRDHGPIFVRRDSDGKRAIIDWDYNAWGGKYPPFDLDNGIPERIAELRELARFTPGLVMEGGAIDVNGAGLLLTTTSCLLNKNRNPHLTQAQIEEALRDYLGVSKILWLGDGIDGDDTDGHVDDMSRFVGPSTVVTALENDPGHPNFEPLMENYRRLLEMTDAAGAPLRVCTLPMPADVELEGRRLPASYANFYIGNKTVLVPIFDCPNDGEALVTLQECFPNRKVFGMDARDLVFGLGAIHCVTQQEPI